MLIHKFLMRITESLPMRLIVVRGKPYLERYHLFKFFGRSVWLHHFVRPDAEEHLHSHPWRALSIVLTGWYLEESRRLFAGWFLMPEMCLRKIRFFNWIGAGKIHRVAKARKHTWTLIFVGQRNPEGWSFFDKLDQEQKMPPTADDWHKSAGTRSDAYVQYWREKRSGIMR